MEVQYRGVGKILFNGKEYRCALYFNEKQGGILLKIYAQHEGAAGDFLELPFEISHLCGQLDSGFKFTLLHLSRTEMEDIFGQGTSEFLFDASYILCGIMTDNLQEPSFHMVHYTLSDIVAWGEETIYSIGEKYELIYRSYEVKKEIYAGPDYKISYLVHGSYLPLMESQLLTEHIDLKQHGVIEIAFEHEVSFSKFNEIFDKAKRLIEIASLRVVNVETVEAYSSSACYVIGDKKSERPITVYGQTIQEYSLSSNYSKKKTPWQWISLSELISNHSFEHYFANHQKLAPIVELFLEPFYITNSSVTRVFLNVVQALETYHSRFVTNELSEFKQLIDDYAKLIPPPCAEKYRKFFIANSNRFITLESRIAHLLYANNEFYFDTGEIDQFAFPAVIANTRNYYIHYDEKKKEKNRILNENELQFYNRVLFKILEYYILKELGLNGDPVKVGEKQNERWGKVSEELEIKKISEERHGLL